MANGNSVQGDESSNRVSSSTAEVEAMDTSNSVGETDRRSDNQNDHSLSTEPTAAASSNASSSANGSASANPSSNLRSVFDR